MVRVGGSVAAVGGSGVCEHTGAVGVDAGGDGVAKGPGKLDGGAWEGRGLDERDKPPGEGSYSRCTPSELDFWHKCGLHLVEAKRRSDSKGTACCWNVASLSCFVQRGGDRTVSEVPKVWRK